MLAGCCRLLLFWHGRRFVHPYVLLTLKLATQIPAKYRFLVIQRVIVLSNVLFTTLVLFFPPFPLTLYVPPFAMPPLQPQIPRGAPLVPAHALRHLAQHLTSCSRITILSGAGISTESGLSDYRSPGKPKPPRPPVNHHEYITDEMVRRGYWSRAFLNYETLSQARPSMAHYGLTALYREAGGLFTGHVTQNVDGLLQEAGIVRESLVELHGNIHGLRCLLCGEQESRPEFQVRLAAENERWVRAIKEGRATMRKDGNVDMCTEVVGEFRVARCARCGGDSMIPTVVFHGGGVDTVDAERAWTMVGASDGLFVVGSTVRLWSAWKLVKRVKEEGGKVVCLNFGETRGDGIWDCKVEGVVGDAVGRLARLLLGGFRIPEESENKGAARAVQL